MTIRVFTRGAVITLFVIFATRSPADELRPAPLEPVPFTQVEITDHFWKQRVDTHYQNTIPHVLDQCKQTGRLRNFRIAAGLEKGEFEGAFFNDSDVYKILEGLAYSLDGPLKASHRSFLDDFITVLSQAQMQDGYLYTFYQVKDELHRQWNEFHMHELYCAGHLIEAGVAHYEATGDRKLLNRVIQFADLIDKNYGPQKRLMPPGHQEIELALARLYRVTGEERYLKLAKFFLQQRGNSNRGEPGNWYEQDHKPLLEQEEAVGHAVRAVYGYCGMTDIAVLTGAERYVEAVDRLWANVVGKKMAISGGIGGGLWEAFDKEYFLPNPSSYNETCGSIAMTLWSHRMFLLHGDAKYIDVMERALFNGVLTGVSLEGDAFFYPNPLESGGGVRQPWFGCACCPSNIARMIPAASGYLYASRGDRLYVNLFASSQVKTELAGQKVALTQETRYPWDGRVKITIGPSTEGPFSLMLRIPGWARNRPVPTDLYRYLTHSHEVATVKVDGKLASTDMRRGYIEIHRTWQPGDVVELSLPMPIRRVVAHPAVKDDRGLVALERGPLVYCVEGVDNASTGRRVQNLRIPDDAQLTAEYHDELLGGTVVLSGNVSYVTRGNDGVSVIEEPHEMAAVPYFARANRGSTPMAVWLLRDRSRALLDPVPSLATRSKVTSSTEGGNFAALRDQIDPVRSADASRGVFNWNGHVGTTEWVQYEFPEPTTVAASDVYWYDRFGTIERRPKSWRLLYQKDGQWLPVKSNEPYEVKLDTYNRVSFEPVRTDAIRLEASLQDAFLDPYLALPSTKPSAFSASILEWRVFESQDEDAAADERSDPTRAM